MNIAIVDDQKQSADDLYRQLHTYCRRRNVTSPKIQTYISGQKLLSDSLDYTLIFLDILMPGPDGMQIARILREDGYRGAIVFTTVLEDYVFDAFSVEAADYLVKPVKENKLFEVLDRVRDKLQPDDRAGLLLKLHGESVIVRARNIEYCEVMGRRLIIHKCDGAVVEGRGRMATLAEQLGSGFCCPHRSYLVNMEFVSRISDNYVELVSGARVPLSRLRRSEFGQAVLEHMSGTRE